MTEDELITAYVDGQLSAQERAALEARAQGDVALRRRIAATQLLSREAQQLPALAAPRNFILPRDMGAKPAPSPEPRRGGLLPTWLFRLGSLAAAGAFALVVAVELFQAPAAAPAPMAAPVDAVTPIATVRAEAARAEAARAEGALAESAASKDMVATAAGTTAAVAPDVTALALPEADTRALPAGTDGTAAAAPAAAAPAAAGSAAMTASDAGSLTATPEPLAFEAASAPPMDAQPQATEAPEIVAPPPAAPALTPLRLFGLLALLAAIVLGALGWLRR